MPTPTIFDAINEGNIPKVEEFIQSGVDVNQVSPVYNCPPLYLAASKNRKIIVDLLLAAGADKDKANSNGSTPLFIAAEKGNLDIVNVLLAAGADKEKAKNNGFAPLHVSSQFGNIDVVNALLAAGADKNKATLMGYTPLYIAADKGNLGIVDVLLAAGADKDTRTNEGATPLFIAAQKGHLAVVNMLLMAGADKDKPMNDGFTPLHIASQKDNKDVVNALLAAGADKDKQTNEGATPLFVAAQNGYLYVVNVLLAAGADKDKPMNDGFTPLHIAIVKGYKDIVNALLTAGADKNKATLTGYTPLILASYWNHKAIVNALLTAGADKDKASQDGATPLFMAAFKNNLDIVNMLLTAGADKDALNNKGETPLYIAALNGHSEVVITLLKAGADFTKPIVGGKSILDYAKAGAFNPKINKIIINLRWEGITQSNVTQFDAIFETESDVTGKKPLALNVSTCPVCFKYVERSEACNYMKHNCSSYGDYYHEELYNKYKNPEGSITWCTICGRICIGHRHYTLSDPSGPVPPLAPVTGSNPFADDCRQDGGGGLDEKLRRFRRAREVMLKELDSSLSYEEAMDILIEEMWRAPLSRLPIKSKMNTMWSTKKFTNYPTEIFPANKKPNTTETEIKKEIQPLTSSFFPVLVNLSTPVMNVATLDEITTILHFKHGLSDVTKPDAHADEIDITKDVSRIGIIGFFDVLKSNIDKGEIGICWKHPECQIPLHPDEVDEVLRLADKEGILNTSFIDLAKRYRGLFTMKFGKVVTTVPTTARVGGGAAGGAGATRRTRRIRQQVGGGKHFVDLVRSKFAYATDAVCVIPKRTTTTSNRRKKMRRFTRRASQTTRTLTPSGRR